MAKEQRRQQVQHAAVMSAQSPDRVRCVDFVMSALCPVYLQQQTFPDPGGTSHLCHKRTISGFPNGRHTPSQYAQVRGAGSLE